MKQVAEGILLKDGAILMGLRAAHKTHYPNCWSFPGGHVEADETIQAALIRELREEVGVEISAYQPLSVLEDTGNDICFHIYLVTEWQGKVGNCSDEHTELDWIALDKASGLPNLAMPDYHKLFDGLLANHLDGVPDET